MNKSTKLISTVLVSKIFGPDVIVFRNARIFVFEHTHQTDRDDWDIMSLPCHVE